MISESFSTLWTRWNLRYSVNFAFGISPNILEPLGSSSYRSHLFIYLFIYFSAFMTFDSVPESHTYKYSTFQAQNPGRFLSCMRKEMALLTFSLPAGIIVRGYEDRVVILCLFSNFFFLYLSQSGAIFFALGAAEMETKVVWNARAVFNRWNPETQMSICLVQRKAKPLIGQKVSCHFLSQSEHQPKINTW